MSSTRLRETRVHHAQRQATALGSHITIVGGEQDIRRGLGGGDAELVAISGDQSHVIRITADDDAASSVRCKLVAADEVAPARVDAARDDRAPGRLDQRLALRLDLPFLEIDSLVAQVLAQGLQAFELGLQPGNLDRLLIRHAIPPSAEALLPTRILPRLEAKKHRDRNRSPSFLYEQVFRALVEPITAQRRRLR